VLHLRVYGRSAKLAEVGGGLEERGAARHSALADGVQPGLAVLTAELDSGSADAALEFLAASGVDDEDITLARVEDVGPISHRHAAVALVWADVMGQARRNARPVARYLVFMIAAGVIAGFGVIYNNPILIVGAMAVSPDVLPVTAVCTGIVSGHWRLAGRALATLAAGLGAVSLTAGLITAALDLVNGLPSGFDVGASALLGLTTINTATIGVALTAGVAGMLALETRASAGVGVAISVTTIPAAAYLGVAAGDGKLSKASGALGVLSVNVAMLIVGGTAALLVQRLLSGRGARASSTHRGDAREIPA